jgi:hypothetical protein
MIKPNNRVLPLKLYRTNPREVGIPRMVENIVVKNAAFRLNSVDEIQISLLKKLWYQRRENASGGNLR